VITPAGRKDTEAMGRSIARSVRCTSKGKDVMSLAELWPCHGEQRPMMRRASAIRDLVASGGTRYCRLQHLQFKTWREGQFLRGASAHALRWQVEQSATPDHVSVATSKVGFREEKTMAWPARLGVLTYRRAGCGHSKSSPVLCAERLFKCHKGMRLMAAHCCAGSRHVGLLAGGASMDSGSLVAAPR
jgi:hypothetical protein